MDTIFSQLGIDWKLFLSQVVNFFILLVILRAFVYKPLLAAIKERNRRIQEGLEKAAAADVRLKEVDNISKDRLKKADQESVRIIEVTHEKSKKLEQSLAAQAEARQKELMEQVKLSHERQLQEARQNVLKEAAELVKKAIIKTVELKPEQIDRALVEKAVSQLSKEK